MKNKITLLIGILYCGFFFAQKWQPIYYADYSYAHRNQIRIGLEWLLNSSEKDDKLFLGTGLGAVYHHEELRLLPDLHMNYNTGSGYFIKAGSSFFNAYILGGISFLNILDLGIGYSLPYQKEKMPIKGFTIGLTLRLTGDDNAYGKMKIGF
ncbi:hypothetical protein [Chryseobacterium herbae]|uniref:DUF3575 domain-containing protein n=1 Tax=Chryseobacterium herbae TaxID=2976476 RepID=A0ABT2J0S6_9FLAO|nr:hypothetical protein [Chryseobacterium sp. pc1-10]MCT2564721.1 hypothetical protein [Chryseobacterium sp. pc1-10]